MIIYEEKTFTKEVPVSTVCDRCGREKEEYEDFVQIRHEFGYGSDKDGNYIEADICGECLLEVLKDCNIKSREYTQWNK